MENMTHKPDAVDIRDNRQLMKERSREVCRVCGSPDVHVDHYGQPTIKCIGYLRDERNRATAELDALRREVEAGKKALKAARYYLGDVHVRDNAHRLGALGSDSVARAIALIDAALEGASR